MTTHSPDDISFFPLKEEWPYHFYKFKSDFMAAIAVSVLTIPQAMAYSLLAGLPLSAGLFASIFSAFIASFWGSSKHLIIGPSNAIAVLIQAGTAEILYTYYRGIEGAPKTEVALQILGSLCFLVAFLQILAAVFKLGRLTQFVSHSVTVGYVVGAAFTVVLNQMYVFLGISLPDGMYSLYDKGFFLVTHLFKSHLPTIFIGVLSGSILFLLRRAGKIIYGPLLMFGWMAMMMYVLPEISLYYTGHGFSRELLNVKIVGDVGSIGYSIPSFSFPYIPIVLMNSLIPTAFAIALLGLMDANSVSKSASASSGQKFSINQEVFGLGLGNLVSSFIGGMPVSASPSRTIVNLASGAKTRISSLLGCLLTYFFIFMFGFFIELIPLASLASLLILTAFQIVNRKQLLICLKATRSDALVLWATVLSCVFFNLDIAFYIGVVISITLYLKKAAIPKLVEYSIDEQGDLHSLTEAEGKERKIRFIKVEGELFFGSADLFQSTLKTLSKDAKTKVIVLQLKNARDIDATTALALLHLSEYMKKSSRYLLACGLTDSLWDVLEDSGVAESMGRENIFCFDENYPHLHMKLAMVRAAELADDGIRIKEEEVKPISPYVNSPSHMKPLV